MKRFIESAVRQQVVLLPESLDDYINSENPVRVIDVFVDELDLGALGFEGVAPASTGRPIYHPSTLLKIYIYGYLNQLQSSRRLERETQRNLELIWLTGPLTPDFKTIADFRKDNGAAIRKVCREFVLLCRRINLFSEPSVAIDGSKFKAVNNRDKNFTDRKLQARIEQLEQSVARYMDELDRADREPAGVPEGRVAHLKEKIQKVREQMRAAPDGQISLTDPDARSMATSGRGTGIVGYNVQTAVDLKTHMIVAHEVVNVGNDRSQLATMAKMAQEAVGHEQLTAFADRGYFRSEEILQCEQNGITPLVPKRGSAGASLLFRGTWGMRISRKTRLLRSWVLSPRGATTSLHVRAAAGWGGCGIRSWMRLAIRTGMNGLPYIPLRGRWTTGLWSTTCAAMAFAFTLRAESASAKGVLP